MTNKEWKELENTETDNDGVAIDRKRFNELLSKTMKEAEHPEWYDSACLCQLCCSYGD